MLFKRDAPDVLSRADTVLPRTIWRIRGKGGIGRTGRECLGSSALLSTSIDFFEKGFSPHNASAKTGCFQDPLSHITMMRRE
jgi:predicted metal-dependent hydrolase